MNLEFRVSGCTTERLEILLHKVGVRRLDRRFTFERASHPLERGPNTARAEDSRAGMASFHPGSHE